MTYDEIPTPAVLVDQTRLLANIRSMQDSCSTHGVELRPHIKTHKMVPIAREQLLAGARGLTCAKIGEAEAMLPSGVRSLFIAHSLVDLRQATRLAALSEQLETCASPPPARLTSNRSIVWRVAWVDVFG